MSGAESDAQTFTSTIGAIVGESLTVACRIEVAASCQGKQWQCLEDMENRKLVLFHVFDLEPADQTKKVAAY